MPDWSCEAIPALISPKSQSSTAHSHLDLGVNQILDAREVRGHGCIRHAVVFPSLPQSLTLQTTIYEAPKENLFRRVK